MEWSVLYMGPVGSGKSTAIRTVSDIGVVSTDQLTSGQAGNRMRRTTVFMDMGMMTLGGTDKLRMFGAPGHDRFDYMLDILLAHSKGVVLLVNHSAADPLSDLDRHLAEFEKRARGLPLDPLVVARSGHLEQFTHPQNLEGGLLSVDQLERPIGLFETFSVTKKAAAFFRNSRSIRS